MDGIKKMITKVIKDSENDDGKLIRTSLFTNIENMVRTLNPNKCCEKPRHKYKILKERKNPDHNWECQNCGFTHYSM